MGAETERWAAVDRWIEARLLGPDEVLEATNRVAAEAGLPPIQVSAIQARLLELLVRASGARRVLEIGTLAGYSTIAMARALPPEGRLVSLELDRRHAEVARANVARAGLAERVEIRPGPARESLAELSREGAPPFDLVFLDADKTGYPDYLRAALALSRPGTVLVADNVVREGAIAEPKQTDAVVTAVRQFLEALGADPRLRATVVPMVGVKGYDGMAIAWVGPGPAVSWPAVSSVGPGDRETSARTTENKSGPPGVPGGPAHRPTGRGP
ncbi:MAG TPA: O-methyltransferase [Thermoplasmata archaeon]|nr:O-methyltransferase [Thermoplasmata archaeon]